MLNTEHRSGNRLYLFLVPLLLLALGLAFAAGASGTVGALAGPAAPLLTPTPSPTCTGGEPAYAVATATCTVLPAQTDTGNHCDDCTTAVTFPFPVIYYGQTFTTANVSSNGTLQFTYNNPTFANSCLPVPALLSTMFPYWDDLRTDGTTCAGGCGIFTRLDGTAPNRTFYIEWRAALYGRSGSVNFEVQFTEGTTSFTFLYGHLDDPGTSATVGLQGNTYTRFVQIECNTGGITEGLCLTFNYDPCVAYTPTITGTPPTYTLTPTNSPTTPPTPPPFGRTNTPTPTCRPGEYDMLIATSSITPGTTDIGNHCDDCLTTVALPFSFPFYGINYTTANVSSNGNIQFATNDPNYSNVCLPWLPLGPTIFALWGDLLTNGTNCPGGCGIFTALSGSAPFRIFYIEWRAEDHHTGGYSNFEVRLSEGSPGRIELVYGTVDGYGVTNTVGIQAGIASSRFLQYSCDTPSISAGREVVFAPIYCPTPVPTCTPTGLQWAPGQSATPARYGVQGGFLSDYNPRFTPIVSYFAVGGLDANNTPTSNMVRYQPISNYWIQMAPVPVPLGKAAVSTDLYHLYTAGGYLGGSGPGSISNQLYIYNPFINTWGTGAPLPAKVESAAGVVAGGRFFVLGGDDGTNVLSSNFSYNITLGSWSTVESLPVPRTNAAATSLGTTVYLFGGLDANGQATDTLFSYSTTTGLWTTLASANTGGLGNYPTISPLGYDHLVATAGGTAGMVPSANTYIYDLLSNTWRPGPPLSTARMGGTQGTLRDGRIVVYAGLTSNSPPAVTGNTELGIPYGACNLTPTPTPTGIGTPTPTFTRTATPPSGTNTPTRTPGGPTNTPTPTITPGGPTNTPTPTGTPCTINFSDVATTDWFHEFVRCLYCRGAISGYADGTFRPYNKTTRGQVSKIVVVAFSIPINTTGGPHFTDVPATDPFYIYVESAYNYGLVSGYADGTFRPGANVTRGQLTKIVVTAAGWPLRTPTNPSFTDVPATNPFYAFIETAVCRGILSGYSDNTFRPFNDTTRAQIAKIVCLATRNPPPCP